MTLEDRLERLANRMPPGDPAEVLTAARARAESPLDSHGPRFLAAAAAVVAVVALAAGGLALAGGNDSDSVTVAGPDTADMASEVTVPESGASAQQLADGTPVWVVRHDDGSVSVIDAVSTHQPFGAGTLVGWCDSSRGFLDPMYGSQFDEHGRSQAGPAPRGLDSYPVVSVAGDTATVTGSPVEQRRAAEGGPEPSEPAGPHCLDEASAPVEGYLSGPFALHSFDSETRVSPEDAVRRPDGTLVLVDAPVVIVEGSQPLVCTSEVGGLPPSCEGLPAPELFLHDQTAAVLRGPFIARPDGGTLTDIAYVGERTITDDRTAEEGDHDPSPTTDDTSASEPSEERADASGGDEAPILQLRGRSFAGDIVTESGHARPLVAGTELTVWFHRNEHSGEDIVAWSGGCNSSGGAVAVTSDRLDVTSDGASSAAGCTEDQHAQDGWFSRFFYSDPYWSLRDGVLRLESGETVVVLDERAWDR